MSTISLPQPGESLVDRMNGSHHKFALNSFAAIVILHWIEHIVQAYQIWVLGWPRPKSLGLIGGLWPWLFKSEWLHYGFAIVMLYFLWVLRHGFVGRGRKWWNASLGLQIWHHFEHLLLLIQALTGSYLLGKAVPTSIVQLFFPRVELHLFYNTAVTIPMIVAMYYHLRPSPEEQEEMSCSCRSHVAQTTAAH
jgi:hypothetical protein